AAAAAKTSAPTPTPALTEAAAPDPRTLMAQGKFAEAARGFEGQVKAAARGSATIQLLVACSPETVQKALDNVKAPELLVLPVDLKGRGCYRLCWGLFDSESRA